MNLTPGEKAALDAYPRALEIASSIFIGREVREAADEVRSLQREGRELNERHHSAWDSMKSRFAMVAAGPVEFRNPADPVLREFAASSHEAVVRLLVMSLALSSYRTESDVREDDFDVGTLSDHCEKLKAGLSIERSKLVPADLGAAEDDSSPTDDSAYVPMKDLWPTRFKSASGCSKFLDKTPDVRAWKPSKYRRNVHTGDWHRYWKEQDRQESEMLDDESIQETIADIEARKEEARAKKRRK